MESKSSLQSSTYEESKGAQVVNIEELLDMDVQKQQKYNNTINIMELIEEDHLKNHSSLGNRSYTYHASTERSHTISNIEGKPNIEYTDEIIEFDVD